MPYLRTTEHRMSSAGVADVSAVFKWLCSLKQGESQLRLQHFISSLTPELFFFFKKKKSMIAFFTEQTQW